MLDLSRVWNNFDLVAFDTETSGAYPIGSEIVEFGAVKFRDGKEIDRFQTLLKPREPMTDFIIGIHGITNEMVADAPLMKQKINEIREFFSGSILMAHHAPFDLGFIALEFEKYNIDFPPEPVLCTSLLARKLIPESPNHKLQTLIPFLKIEKGAAHRAADDSAACIQVGLECFRRAGMVSIESLLQIQEKKLFWDDYRILTAGDSKIDRLRMAIEEREALDIVYAGGSSGGERRRIGPIGLVRNPDGDYVMARCFRDGANKRFYLAKMSLV